MPKMAYARFAGMRSSRKYPVVESVELREDARFPASSGGSVLGVFKGGYAVGYIRKFTDTPTESFPWQGFNYPMGFRCGPKMTGSFYGCDGKRRAVESVLA